MKSKFLSPKLSLLENLILIWIFLSGLQLDLTSLAHGSTIFVSNGTGIIKFHLYTKDIQQIVSQPKGQIVGLAVDVADDLLFWSDVSLDHRAIYRSALNGSSVEIILEDVSECNGLSADWMSNHIYWTDAVKQTLEIANYDGSGRRIIFSLTGGFEPRGIIVDPVLGYLFWADQMNGQVERSRLDGSDRKVIIDSQVYWPNQLAISRVFRKLYWVEASPPTGIMSCDIDGSDYRKERDLFDITSGNPSFGLALIGNKALVSTWFSNAIYSSPIETSYPIWTEEVKNLGSNQLFSLVVGDFSSQPSSNGHPCGMPDKAGCSHLCLPSGWSSDFTCVCPSYTGLVIGQDGKTCQMPEGMLFYTFRDSGEVGIISEAETEHPSLNIIGRSHSPSAVVFDPVDQNVYWSDTERNVIYRAKFGSRNKEVFMNDSDGIGVVENMAVDIPGRSLYFTNSGYSAMSLMDNTLDMWYRIELVSFDKTIRRTLQTMTNKPTGITLDAESGVLFYSTCERKRMVIYSVLLDGSALNTLHHPSIVTCPSSLTFHKSQLYVVGSGQQGELSYILSYSRNITEVWSTLLTTESALHYATATDSVLYFSQYSEKGQGQIKTFDLVNGEQAMFLSTAHQPSGLFYSPGTYIPGSYNDPCSDSPCSDICVRVASPDSSSYKCACRDGAVSMLSDDGVSCTRPENFIIFADLNTIKQISLDIGTSDRVNTVYYSLSKSNIYSVLYDDTSDTIYWTDQTRSSIFAMALNEMRPRQIYMGDTLIFGLALDVVKQRLYWSAVDSEKNGHIMRLKLKHAHKAKLIISTRGTPRALTVCPENRWLYWTEYDDESHGLRGDNSVASIHRAHLNGHFHQILLEEDLTWPNSLTISDRKLYVADGVGKIWKMNLDGSNPEELSFLTGSIQHIFDVRITGNALFYTDWSTHALYMVDMKTGRGDIIAANLTRPTTMAVYQSKNSQRYDLCATDMNECSHGCVSLPKTVHCACPVGYKLGDDDQKRCIKGQSRWIQKRISHCKTQCSEYAQCSQLLSTLQFQCVCLPGYHGNGSDCEACPVDFYKPQLDNTTCLPCPVPMTTRNKTSSVNCSCFNIHEINGTCSDAHGVKAKDKGQ